MQSILMKIIFTTHAEFRLQRRGILKEEVIYIINFPDIVLKKHGKYFFQKKLHGGTIEVVTEKDENFLYVITLYWI